MCMKNAAAAQLASGSVGQGEPASTVPEAQELADGEIPGTLKNGEV